MPKIAAIILIDQNSNSTCLNPFFLGSEYKSFSKFKQKYSAFLSREKTDHFSLMSPRRLILTERPFIKIHSGEKKSVSLRHLVCRKLKTLSRFQIIVRNNKFSKLCYIGCLIFNRFWSNIPNDIKITIRKKKPKKIFKEI